MYVPRSLQFGNDTRHYKRMSSLCGGRRETPEDLKLNIFGTPKGDGKRQRQMGEVGGGESKILFPSIACSAVGDYLLC